MFKKDKKGDNESIKHGVRMVTASSSDPVINEQFNTLRTNIQFSNVDTEYKKIMITSPTMSEGKSTVAANIATSFAKAGKSTLLVDADLRRPTIRSTFMISQNNGITNFLTERDFNLNSAVYKTTLANLYVLPSGPIPPNPSELIVSKKMKNMIKNSFKSFDLVIFDAPPLLSVTDGQILSTLVDGTIIVLRDNYTEKQSALEAVDMVNHVNGHIIGAILNDVNDSSEGYYGYYSNDISKG